MFFHLQQPGSEPVIQQHVKAQDLKTGAAADVVGEACVVIMFEDGMSGDQSLYDHVLDVIPHRVRVATDGFQVFVQGRQLTGDGKTQQTCNEYSTFRNGTSIICMLHTVYCHCPHCGQSSRCSC